jgi:hypothetical protein
MRAVRQGDNPYCGPAVLSILTGKSTDECASILMQVTGRRDIKEIYLSELEAALKKMRFTFEQRAVDCSMYSFFMQVNKENGFYILSLPRHVVAIEVVDGKIFLCDNHTKEPMNAANSARLGQRVMLAYKVEPKPEPILIAKEIKISREIGYENQVFLSIQRNNFYSVKEDDTTTNLGTFRASSLDELKEIVEKLKESLND